MSQLIVKGQVKEKGFNSKSFAGKKNQQSTKEYLIEWVERDFQKKLHVIAWNSFIAEMDAIVGKGEKTFTIDVLSNFSNGKYFTNAKVWRVS